jgi:succinate-acetate transporter protein
MSFPQYEFDSEQSSHFTRLAKKANWTAIFLSIFAVANLYVIVRTPGNPLHLFINIALIVLSAFTALALQKAAAGFVAITKTQGSDISLLQASNRKLQLAFTLLAWTFAILTIRFIYHSPSIIKVVT